MGLHIDIHTDIDLLELSRGVRNRSRRGNGRVQRSRHIRNLLTNLERSLAAIGHTHLRIIQKTRIRIAQQSLAQRRPASASEKLLVESLPIREAEIVLPVVVVVEFVLRS